MIDLHVHSTASDGTATPEELAAMGGDFYAMALTDHDNCDGADAFLAACAGGGGVRLAGIELSVAPGEGYDRFHMLGLGIDPHNERLKGFLDRVLEGRMSRNGKILARFAEIGVEMPEAELSAYAQGRIVARPHFARWLVDHGRAADVKEAFATYLTPESPAGTNCYVARFRPDPGEAIDAIHAAGGVAVMAHPRFWTGDPAKLRAGLRRLRDRGLDGIEAVYQANSRSETVDHLIAARETGLCVTAGSDFHGKNKPSVHLGMEVDDDRTFLAPFFRRLDSRRGAAEG